MGKWKYDIFEFDISGIALLFFIVLLGVFMTILLLWALVGLPQLKAVADPICTEHYNTSAEIGDTHTSIPWIGGQCFSCQLIDNHPGYVIKTPMNETICLR